jgi:hypothetical protein
MMMDSLVFCFSGIDFISSSCLKRNFSSRFLFSFNSLNIQVGMDSASSLGRQYGFQTMVSRTGTGIVTHFRF